MTDPYVVWVAGVGWDTIQATDRHLVSALARHARVLWVDPPGSPLTPARYRGTARRTLAPRLSAVADRITRLTPVALPGLTRPGVRATTWPLVRGQLRWALHRLGIRPFAVVTSTLDDVLGRWGAGVVNVLYGTDDYVAGAGLMGLDPGWLRRQEQRALARADVVVTVSAGLRDRWAALRAELLGRPAAAPVQVPNGCDVAGFAGVEPLGPPPPVRLPRPVAGLVGQLSDRIDLALLEAVADAGLSLLLVGPREPRWQPERFGELAARPNVHYAGPVSAQALPAYLGALDVGITPYRDTAFNRASFPLKTLEYLAAGRAAVSTDLPAVRWLLDDLATARLEPAGLLTVAGPDPASFAAAVAAAAAEPASPALVERRRQFAARHSWARRADSFARAIGLPVPPAAAADPAPTTVEVP